MTSFMLLSEWLPVIQREYLRTFVKEGGASVKFAIPVNGMSKEAVNEGLKSVAEAEGYLFVPIDAATTKVHMIDKLFHTVAKQVPWDELAWVFIRRNLSDRVRLPQDQKEMTIENLAQLNSSLSLADMNEKINATLKERLWQEYSMTQEFRIAMVKLCHSLLDPTGTGPSTAATIKEWLRGDLRLISTLKSAQIFQKIDRYNARHMIASLAYWLHLTGQSGLCVTLDISQFLDAQRPKDTDGTLRYTKSAVLGGYEVLRQFIDDTDELKYFLMVIIAPLTVLEQEGKRSLWRYNALKLRVWDEVYDRQRVNPLASLVRLGGGASLAVAPAYGGPS